LNPQKLICAKKRRSEPGDLQACATDVLEFREAGKLFGRSVME